MRVYSVCVAYRYTLETRQTLNEFLSNHMTNTFYENLSNTIWCRSFICIYRTIIYNLATASLPPIPPTPNIYDRIYTHIDTNLICGRFTQVGCLHGTKNNVFDRTAVSYYKCTYIQYTYLYYIYVCMYLCMYIYIGYLIFV